MNVDTLRTSDSTEALINNLELNDIDIACVAETHAITEMATYNNKYTIIYSVCVWGWHQNKQSH